MLSWICSRHCLSLTHEVAVAVVDRLELAAVDGQDGLRGEIKLPTLHDELAAHPPDRLAVVLAEVGDGFEVQ